MIPGDDARPPAGSGRRGQGGGRERGGPRGLAADERAVSIAVTHVLAIGITTLLMTALLLGASGLLEDQQDRAARTELRTIGNRLATQIAKGDALVSGTDDGTERVTFHVDQPSKIAGGTYTAVLEPGSECDNEARPPGRDPDLCIVLESGNPEVNIRPVKVPVDFDDDGGDVSVELQNRGSGNFVIVVEDPP